MFSSLFNWLMGAGRELAVVLISMVPLLELPGAVPLGAVAGVPAIELMTAIRPPPWLRKWPKAAVTILTNPSPLVRRVFSSMSGRSAVLRLPMPEAWK